MTVKQKLFALALVGLLSNLVVGVAGWSGMVSLGRTGASLRANATTLRNHLEADMMHDALRGDVLTVITGESDAERRAVLADVTAHAATFRGALAANEALLQPGHARELIAGMRLAVDRYIDEAGRVVREGVESVAAARADYPAFLAAFEELEGKMSATSAALEAESAREQAAGAASARAVRWWLLLAGLLASALLAGLSWRIARGIVGRLAAAVGCAERVSAGDLGARIAVGPGDGDELGRMAVAFNDAVESLATTTKGVQLNATRLVAESDSLARVSRQVSASTSDAAGRASAVAEGANGVSRSVRSVAGAMDQLEQSIGEISRSAALAADVAGQAVESARAAEATVARLEQASDEIGGITNLITSIAEQTNLLALNATIEAARAGEAGRGFAVVAGEVKELAKATAGATESISSKVEAIRRDIRATTSAIGKIAGTIGEISAHQTTIASAVEEQTATTKDIGGTLADAASGAQQIAGTIEGVAEASRQTVGGAASTLDAAQALVGMAADLEALVGRFSTGERPQARDGLAPPVRATRGNATRRRARVAV
jgi:methyl-accepting chemotaxis protein